MNDVTQFWCLTSPMACRDFLKQVRWKGEDGEECWIDGFRKLDGAWIELKDATDEQVLELANEISGKIEAGQL